MATKVMISCGEASGDLYAAALASELSRADPDGRVFGLGGDRLAAAGAELVGHYGGLSVTGLVEALAVVPRALAMLRQLVAVARSRRPDVLVVIDFPDFNFRLASAVRRLEYLWSIMSGRKSGRGARDGCARCGASWSGCW